MNCRRSAPAVLVLLALCAPARADWLYNWAGGGPSGDFGAVADPSNPTLPTGRDIRAYAQYLFPPGVTDMFWDSYAALYGATDRSAGFQAFRMDLKGTPTDANHAEWYVMAVDGLPAQGTTLGGISGIDRIIATPYNTGSGLGEPILFKWTGSAFDAGTPFSSITGAQWQYGFGETYYPPLFPVPPFTAGYGSTLEWLLPIGELGTGPFTFAGATLSDLLNPTIYDSTIGASLGAASLIPEPSTVALLGLGGLGLIGYAWRRRRARA